MFMLLLHRQRQTPLQTQQNNLMPAASQHCSHPSAPALHFFSIAVQPTDSAAGATNPTAAAAAAAVRTAVTAVTAAAAAATDSLQQASSSLLLTHQPLCLTVSTASAPIPHLSPTLTLFAATVTLLLLVLPHDIIFKLDYVIFVNPVGFRMTNKDVHTLEKAVHILALSTEGLQGCRGHAAVLPSC
jgi:hypothetical protein